MRGLKCHIIFNMSGCARPAGYTVAACTVVTMTLNFTGIDIDLFFTVGSAVTGLLLCGIVIPTLILIVICVIAIINAKELCGQMKALLINIFAGEVCNWLSLAFYCTQAIITTQLDLMVSILCGSFISLYFVATLQISSGTSLYAILVYMYLKYGLAKLKWKVIVAYIAVSWVVALAVSTLPYIPTYGWFVNDLGLCDLPRESVLHTSTSASAVALGFVHLVLIITFTVLTYCYIKKHTVEDSVEVKKAVAKTLQYLMVSAIISFIYTIPSALPNIRSSNTLAGLSLIYRVALLYYMPVVLTSVLSAITPIVTIILLKPAREAMRNTCQKLICNAGNNTVHPA